MVGRGEDFEGVAAVVECFRDIAAAKFITADVMRRVEIGEDKDAHGKVDLLKVIGMGGMGHSPQKRVNVLLPPSNVGAGLRCILESLMVY